MELNTQIAEHTKAIVVDVNLLLNEDSLSAKQREAISKILIFTEKIIFYYENYAVELAAEENKPRVPTIMANMLHELRSMCSGIQLRCSIIETMENRSHWSEKAAETFLQIQKHNRFISDEVEKLDKSYRLD